MTITSPSMQRLAGVVLFALCAAPASVLAQQQRQPSTYQPPSDNAIQAQQANQQAILQDRLRTSQLQEEQRQRSAAATRQPLSANPAATQALDLSNQAQQQRFDARQRDVVDQYRAASSTAPVVLPQPVRQAAPKKPSQPSVLDQLHPTPPQNPPQR